MATSRSERASGPLFKRILVANRGEIAVRVMRACRELGIESVAVYSEPDRGALHVRQADHAYPIGPARAAESYLRIDKLIAAAKESGAEAVHPGYGFLSERAAFAQACADAGLVFIGPSARAITAMGDKVEARRLMRKAGVPVVPGSDDALGSDAEEGMGRVAVAAARAVDYVGAGTIEFLVDQERRFYFLEMNTRIQVEHPITEAVTGVDLVKAQIEIAAGRALGFAQEDVVQRGWAIECRIYAEDPENGFLPAPGRIVVLRVPSGIGIRDDSGVYEGFEVSINYDPILSKLVAWGSNRDEAIDRMLRALGEYVIVGPTANIAFHRWALGHPAFRSGDIDTGFIARHFAPGALAEGTEADLPLIGPALAAMARSGPVTGANGARPPGLPRSRWRELARREALRE